MKHKLSWFLLSSGIISLVIGFFKNNPPGSGTMYYPMFAIVLFLIGIAAAFVWVVVVSTALGLAISHWRKNTTYTPPAYQPMPEECDGHCAPGECLCKDKAAHPELYDEPKVASHIEENIEFMAQDARTGEETILEADELPKDEFNGFVEATPDVVPPSPVQAPHENSNDPNYDAAAGRVIYK